MDTLEGLRNYDLLTQARLGHAQKTLHRLEQEIPQHAQPILLSAAHRATKALINTGEGFFLMDPTKNVIPGGDGRPPMPIEEATAQLVKLLRKITHGHGPKNAKDAALSQRLLAVHDGRFPADLALLSHLYLLDLLANPERLRRIYQARSSKLET